MSTALQINGSKRSVGISEKARLKRLLQVEREMHDKTLAALAIAHGQLVRVGKTLDGLETAFITLTGMAPADFLRETNMPKHYCHAIDCIAIVPPKLLMCAKHWRMVPRDLQMAVYREYVPGQEITKTPTQAYLAAAAAAINAVWAKERANI